jgi:hypothetical protein
MKYTTHKLDGRYRYRTWFEYYVGFSGRMSDNAGPVAFNQALRWFINTYGWSAEVRQYEDMYNWSIVKVPFMSVKGGFARSVPKQLPDDCNKYWSWSNSPLNQELRIYVATDKELAYFQLANPCQVQK